ncbi:MAG TPA: OmpA family protein [Verrucomicrobiota bacterium]|nr:OmpA family protein [Verrucomicrobiota bacterium]HNT15893.1 OmpA family protein [Verrucomicrobiota bacterium]
MKAIQLSSLLAVVLALSLLGTGCQKRVIGPTPINKSESRIRPGEISDNLPSYNANNSGSGVSGADLDTATGAHAQSGQFSLDNSTQDRAALAGHTVHFDFDSSVVRSDERGNVDAVAGYMQGNPAVGLLIEGHCDERGTDGYNDALGERRASALREVLISQGVAAERIITQSWGKRRPVDLGHNEAAWAKNRRGEFVVLHAK